MEDFVAVVDELENTLLVSIDVEILFDKGDEFSLFLKLSFVVCMLTVRFSVTIKFDTGSQKCGNNRLTFHRNVRCGTSPPICCAAA